MNNVGTKERRIMSQGMKVDRVSKPNPEQKHRIQIKQSIGKRGGGGGQGGDGGGLYGPS